MPSKAPLHFCYMMMSTTLLKSRCMTYCIKNVPSSVHESAVFEHLGGERLAYRVGLVH